MKRTTQFLAVMALVCALATATWAAVSAPWSGTGTATTSPASVSVLSPYPGNPATFLAIQNDDGTNNLLVSIDGTTYLTVFPKGAFAISASLRSVLVKSSASTVVYEWAARSGN